jgi:hypothetical protein
MSTASPKFLPPDDPDRRVAQPRNQDDGTIPSEKVDIAHSTRGDNNQSTQKEPRTVEFFLTWTLQVLGVTAAVIFGIWAPLSYKASADGNSQNDAAQSVLLSSVAAASSSIASQLDDLNTKLFDSNSRLADANSRMAAIGQLSLLEFCLG